MGKISSIIFITGLKLKSPRRVHDSFQVRSLVRRARSAEPGNGDGKKNAKKNDKGKKGKGKGRKGKGNARKGGKKGGKGGGKKGGKTGGKKNRKNEDKKKKGKGGNKKNGKKDKKKGNKDKKGRSGKSSDLLPDFVYNQLWCFDLAMEQVSLFYQS